jgi:hypothetical protein
MYFRMQSIFLSRREMGYECRLLGAPLSTPALSRRWILMARESVSRRTCKAQVERASLR